ncbi:MAG TPA: hypothetical protein VFN80_06590 [Acidothermaceae bacterium]|nr:hypothetical protein [Acidothermaceae bacterium]
MTALADTQRRRARPATAPGARDDVHYDVRDAVRVDASSTRSLTAIRRPSSGAAVQEVA